MCPDIVRILNFTFLFQSKREHETSFEVYINVKFWQTMSLLILSRNLPGRKASNQAPVIFWLKLTFDNFF